MTLQELTDKLQLFAHHGHAQDQIVIGNIETFPKSVDLTAAESGRIAIFWRK